MSSYYFYTEIIIISLLSIITANIWTDYLRRVIDINKINIKYFGLICILMLLLALSILYILFYFKDNEEELKDKNKRLFTTIPNVNNL